MPKLLEMRWSDDKTRRVELYDRDTETNGFVSLYVRFNEAGEGTVVMTKYWAPGGGLQEVLDEAETWLANEDETLAN